MGSLSLSKKEVWIDAILGTGTPRVHHYDAHPHLVCRDTFYCHDRMVWDREKLDGLSLGELVEFYNLLKGRV